MNNRGGPRGELGAVGTQLTANADALLDSLFADDQWDASDKSPALTSSTAAPFMPPTGMHNPGGEQAIPERTAEPPAVNPAGPVRREPFSRSPGAPVITERKPFIVPRKQGNRPTTVAVSDSTESQISPSNSSQYSTLSDAVVHFATTPVAAPSTDSTSWITRPRSASERAIGLQHEADQQSDPLYKGRLLLVISELWSSAQSHELATQAARSACELLPDSAIAHRQLRQLCMLRRDAAGALAALEVELQNTPEAMRAHLLGIRATLCLVNRTDPLQLELAMNALAEGVQSDPRPALFRLAQELAAGPFVPELTVASETAATAVDRARADACRFRETIITKDPPVDTRKFNSDQDGPISLNFLRAKQAFQARDLRSAADAVLQLSNLPAMAGACRWLAAAVSDGPGRNRQQSIELLTELASTNPDGLAHRALARSSLSDNNLKSLFDALNTAPPAAFTPIERLLLAALAFKPTEIPADWSTSLVCGVALTPITLALRAILGIHDLTTNLSDDDPSLQALEFGRLLTQNAPLSEQSLIALQMNNHCEPLAIVLQLEQARKEGNPAAVVKGLLLWANHSGFEDLTFIAAIQSELAGDKSRSAEICRQILTTNPGSECALRMAEDLGVAVTAADFEVLARSCTNPERASLFLLEAAARVDASATGEFLRLLTCSVERCPTLPFAYRWANQFARERSDPRILLDWLERGRVALPQPNCWAIEAIQTALLLSESDRSQATQLIAETAAAFPLDIGLQQLGEKIAASAWGSWRESMAETRTNGQEKAQLLIEATLATQHSNLSHSVHLAHQAARANGSGILVELHRHLADQLAHPTWVKLQQLQLERASSAQLELEGHKRVAALAEWSADLALAKHEWQQVVSQEPNSLEGLGGLEHLQITTDATDELTATEGRLAILFDDDHATAHALMYLRWATQHEASDETRAILECLMKHQAPPLAVLRAAQELAATHADRPTQLEVALTLLDRARGADDIAALALHAAKLAIAQNDLQQAKELLDRALGAIPNHVVALALQIELHKTQGHWSGAAQSLGAFAASSRVNRHRAQALAEAGLLWLDRLNDIERGEAALEEAGHLDPDNEQVAQRLCEHYFSTQQRVKLLDLLDIRLAGVLKSETRARLQAQRNNIHEEIGGTPRLRQVAPKVDASPEHHDALEAFALRAFANGDLNTAEDAWLQLVRIVHDPIKQAEYYRGLGDLYVMGGKNLQRAAVCYAEVRRRLANDVAVAEKLVALYEQLEQGDRAIQLQTELLKGARDDAERRTWTIKLAHLYATCAHDLKHAELTLQQARKSLPHDAKVLKALAQLYRQSGQESALTLLLDRASNDARHSLASGALDPAPFEILQAAAELKGNFDAESTIGATLSALKGEGHAVAGIGAIAGATRFEKFLIPDAISPALRTLLNEVGSALDSAAAEEFTQLTVTPLSQIDNNLSLYCQQLARDFGFNNTEFYVSTLVATEVIAHNSNPEQIVIGESLLALGDRPLLTFFLYRALKAVSAHCCALLRGSSSECQYRLTSLLCCFVPDWQPPGIDRSLIQPFSDKIRKHFPSALSTDMTLLANEVIATSGTKLAQMNNLLERWVMRTAMLACGDSNIALRAVSALVTGSAQLPVEGAARMRWIATTAMARDLLLFCVTDEYLGARRHLQELETNALQ